MPRRKKGRVEKLPPRKEPIQIRRQSFGEQEHHFYRERQGTYLGIARELDKVLKPENNRKHQDDFNTIPTYTDGSSVVNLNIKSFPNIGFTREALNPISQKLKEIDHKTPEPKYRRKAGRQEYLRVTTPMRTVSSLELIRKNNTYRPPSGITTPMTRSCTPSNVFQQSPEIKISKPNLKNFSRFDNFTANIIKTTITKGKKTTLDEGLLTEKKLPKTQATPLDPTIELDVVAMQRMNFAQDCRSAFATARIPTLRRSPAYIQYPPTLCAQESRYEIAHNISSASFALPSPFTSTTNSIGILRSKTNMAPIDNDQKLPSILRLPSRALHPGIISNSQVAKGQYYNRDGLPNDLTKGRSVTFRSQSNLGSKISSPSAIGSMSRVVQSHSSIGQKQKGFTRIDQHGLGSPRFYFWAPFNDAKVNQIRCLVLKNAHLLSVGLVHQSATFPRNDEVGQLVSRYRQVMSSAAASTANKRLSRVRRRRRSTKESLEEPNIELDQDLITLVRGRSNHDETS